MDKVFINCPFDDLYKPLFHATVFTVTFLGFDAICALERDGAQDLRLQKIISMIDESKMEFMI
jgi:hypothetical protein